MSPRLPEGAPGPPDGRLPASALAELGDVPFGIYVHVPWCASRCGYCDFNTYVPAPDALDALGTRFVRAARLELELAARVLGRAGGRAAGPVATVFLGGGTPSLLAPERLGEVLDAVRSTLGLAADAEVTCECNPESVDPGRLARLRSAGVTRVSLGMQSARGHVLDALERRHAPGRAEAAVAEARAAGFDAVGLDLIYGAHGETDEDWAATLDAAIGAAPDSISAYALSVEPGTRYAAHVRHGTRRVTDDDVLADRWAHAEARLEAAGYAWYELSNWARTPAGICRHNEGYWDGGAWWGVGPGAHSHVGGVRWWNVLRPEAWFAALEDGRSPAAGREVLTPAERRLEMLMTRIRRPAGVPLPQDAGAARAARELADAGLADPRALDAGRVVLTRRGRPLADAVVRRLVD